MWEQVIRNCEDALSIDSANVKAIFRRSTYFEHKKEWEKAMADIKKFVLILTTYYCYLLVLSPPLFTKCYCSSLCNLHVNSHNISRCQELTKDGPEDVLVTKAFERVKKEQQKEKDKEKKMWGKAFS